MGKIFIFSLCPPIMVLKNFEEYVGAAILVAIFSFLLFAPIALIFLHIYEESQESQSSEPQGKWLDSEDLYINLSNCSQKNNCFKKPVYYYSYTIKKFQNKEDAEEYMKQCEKEGGIAGICYDEPYAFAKNISIVCAKKTVGAYICSSPDFFYLVSLDGKILMENPIYNAHYLVRIKSIIDSSKYELMECASLIGNIKFYNSLIITDRPCLFS